MAETICSCCGRFLVCRIEDRWACWFCDSSNVTPWKCSKQHGTSASSSVTSALSESKAETTSSNQPEEATILDYFNGTYVFEGKAKVVRVNQANDEKSKGKNTLEVILDRTLFHPQGGGQPSDVGTISSADGQSVFVVTGVQMKDRKIVVHSGNFQSSSHFSQGSSVVLAVDRQTRETAARVHSAGHLLDIAVAKAGFKLVPTKGYHFPDGPYVEYEGEIAPEQKDKAVQQIQEALDALLATQGGLPVSSQIVPYGDITKLCGSTPSYMPADKPARVVAFQDSLGCPCGGTHVENSRQIGVCRVTKISKRKNILRICYEIS